MNHSFNLTRYSKLIEKETALANKRKSLFSENQSEYLELLNYQASVEQQIIYNRKNDYFLLIDKYLNQLINPSEFSNLMGQISDLCQEVINLGYGDGLSKDEFYYSVNNLYLQLKMGFSISP